ncbi:FGGY family carbohydrate kinase [Faecalicatena contorta]|uniref:FGGY family carbohydrate kinase n=1 Tax=Faecalicatena contorta TaxID=39482 RepID=UPI001EFF535B|nr:FGGY family carbohydrate kinase [Faecalicatena contorta]MCF2555848.1 carbohydrate kinase [Faecalicatena contorta]
MKETYLTIDLGTGNSRVALADISGNIIDLISFENIYYEEKNAKYFIPKQWFKKIMDAASSLANAHPELRIIAVSATSAREGIVLIDKHGHCPVGLPNIDRRGNQYMNHFSNYSDKIYSLSGRWLDSLFSALKLVGFRETNPNDFSFIKSFTSLSEWIGYSLTGQTGISPSHACETQLFDIHTRKWSEELCSIFQINTDILPPLIESGQVLGTVTSDFSATLHLTEPVPFIVSGADTQTAAYGVNAQENDTVIISGTTTPIVSLLSSLPSDISKKCWTDCGLHHNWLIETNAGTTGLNLQNYKNNFMPDIDYSLLEKEISCRKTFKCIASFGTKQFSENLTIKKGGLYMSAPFDSGIDRFDFARSILADSACGIALHYKELISIHPHDSSYILGCGGGFQSKVFSQWLADLTNKEIVLHKHFRQASIAGCVRICNEHFHLSTNDMEVVSIFAPQKKNNSIHDYYEQWLQIRSENITKSM